MKNFKENERHLFDVEAKKRGLVVGAKVSFKKRYGTFKGIIKRIYWAYWASGDKCFSAELNTGEFIPLFLDGVWAKLEKSENCSIAKCLTQIEALKQQITTLNKQKGGYVKANNDYREKVKELKYVIEENIKLLDLCNKNYNKLQENEKALHEELTEIKSKWWYKLFS